MNIKTTDDINIGDRIKVFDDRLFKDDVSTPLSETMRPCKVIRIYGSKTEAYPDFPVRIYPEQIDVVFDHRPDNVSKGHLPPYAKINEEF